MVYPYDTTPFVKISINEVVKMLAEAIVLMFLVMYLFLQNFRTTLTLTIVVPVVLLGTFTVLSAFGYSINTSTMFAMVLAIGLLVNDAIVVVENVKCVMMEEGLSRPRKPPRNQCRRFRKCWSILRPIYSDGVHGQFYRCHYRQFSITIESAMVLSVLIALILTPALCATLLKPIAKGDHHEKRVSSVGSTSCLKRAPPITPIILTIFAQYLPLSGSLPADCG
ncbi:MAG: efflux RND transporter permease subunit [Symbiopectobacterium sp.]